MHRKWTALLLVSMMTVLTALAGMGYAGAEMLLPTPEPKEDSQSLQMELPTVSVSEIRVMPLPSLSAFLQVTGEKKEDFLQSDQYQADAVLYPTSVIGNAIGDYLTVCAESGYSWTMSEDFSNAFAYKITGGGYTAYLIPSYGDSILLLTEKGMPVEQEQEMSAGALEARRMMLKVNGSQYMLDEKDILLTVDGLLEKSFISNAAYRIILSESDFSSPVSDYGTTAGRGLTFESRSHQMARVYLSIPANRTGSTFTVTRDSNPDNISFIMTEASGDTPVDIECFTKDSVRMGLYRLNWDPAALYNVRKGLDSEEDYLTVSILYDQTEPDGKQQCKAVFEGSLCGGTLQISGTVNSYK